MIPRRLSLLLALIAVCPASVRGLGVTVITHGYGGDVNGWIAAMADRIPRYPSFPGTNFTTYTVTLTTDGSGNYFYQWQRTNGSPPSVTDSGEIIVKLDWSQMAGGSLFNYDISTYTVASVASYVLLQTNAISELGGHALAEFPLHLIGHSRGGSLISEISHQLGTNGLWLDHLTTLDPHPLNNDGFSDPISVTDAPVHTYVNVLFHDNYSENVNFYPWGESVAGACIRPLDNSLTSDPSGGYSSYHSDVHLWYHGTIDWSTPATYSYAGDSATIDATMRADWWVPYESSGVHAGFLYTLIAGGNRLSTDQPLGPGFSAIRDGYNQVWDVGAGVANNRTALEANNGAWPNLIRCDRTDTNQVAQGQNVSLKLYYQWAASATSNATINFYLDNDLNSLNTNQTLLAQTTVPSTGASAVNSVTIPVPLYPTNAAPGWHSILASISGGGRTRCLYAPEWVQVMPGRQPPAVDIAQINPVQLRIGVNGLVGQTVILQASSDLTAWQPLATNTLTSPRFLYTNTISAGNARQFFRAALAN